MRSQHSAGEQHVRRFLARKHILKFQLLAGQQKVRAVLWPQVHELR